MTHTVPTQPDDEIPSPAEPGGGWLSGPAITPGSAPFRHDPPERPSAPLPSFSPAELVLRVQELLMRDGLTVVVDLGSTNTAVIAAADLLRALGVAPRNGLGLRK